MANIGELFVQLGFFADTKELEEANKKLKETEEAINDVIEETQRLIDENKELAEADKEVADAKREAEQTDRELVDAINAVNEAKTEEEKTTAELNKELAEENHQRALNRQKTAEENKERLLLIQQKKRELDETKKQSRENQKQINKQNAIKKNIKDTATKIAGFVASVSIAVAALNKMTEALAKNNQQWLNMSRQSGVGLKTLQKYAGVAGVLDKTLGAEGAAASIADLQKRLFKLNLTGEGAGGFQIAGINPYGKNAEQVIEQLRERIKGLDDAKATFVLEQVGLDPRLLPMLRMTREEFEAYNKELQKYQLTDSQRRQMDAWNRSLDLSRKRLQSIKDKALVAIMPAFARFMDRLSRIAYGLAKLGKQIGLFLTKWGVLIAGFSVFTRKVKPITAFFSKFGAFLKPISKGLGQLITKIPVVGRLLSGLLGGLGTYLGWIIAIFLLIDDIMTGLEGGDSYTKDFMDWYNDFYNTPPKWMEKLAEIIVNLKELFHKEPKLFKPLTDDELSILKQKGYKWDNKREILKLSLPKLNPAPPINNRTVSNNTTNNNSTINMHNAISTSQPAQSIYDNLIFTQMLFNSNY